MPFKAFSYLFSFLLFSFLVSCQQKEVKPDLFGEEVRISLAECNSRLTNGEFTLLSQMLEKCQKPNNLRIYKKYHGDANLDIMTASEDKNIELRKLVETNKITAEEFSIQMAEFNRNQIELMKGRK